MQEDHETYGLIRFATNSLKPMAEWTLALRLTDIEPGYAPDFGGVTLSSL